MRIPYVVLMQINFLPGKKLQQSQQASSNISKQASNQTKQAEIEARLFNISIAGVK